MCTAAHTHSNLLTVLGRTKTHRTYAITHTLDIQTHLFTVNAVVFYMTVNEVTGCFWFVVKI